MLLFSEERAILKVAARMHATTPYGAGWKIKVRSRSITFIHTLTSIRLNNDYRLRFDDKRSND